MISLLKKQFLHLVAISALLIGSARHAPATIISFRASDFDVITPVYNDVQAFDFTIDTAETIVPGVRYNNPMLNSLIYHVSGSLLPEGSPSGFPGFAFEGDFTGPDFYAQGSSLSFGVLTGADLTDGLQADELDGPFVFDGREVGTGRYHPAFLRLNTNGTGLIENSNNSGGVNPVSMEVVDVDFGEEYITALQFTPSTFTLVAAVPEPASAGICALACIGAVLRRRRS